MQCSFHLVKISALLPCCLADGISVPLEHLPHCSVNMGSPSRQNRWPPPSFGLLAVQDACCLLCVLSTVLLNGRQLYPLLSKASSAWALYASPPVSGSGAFGLPAFPTSSLSCPCSELSSLQLLECSWKCFRILVSLVCSSWFCSPPANS